MGEEIEIKIIPEDAGMGPEDLLSIVWGVVSLSESDGILWKSISVVKVDCKRSSLMD